jgi:branched-chain amino acid transport system substrate-binding protein
VRGITGLITVIALTICACGPSAGPAGTTGQGQASPTAPLETYVVAISADATGSLKANGVPTKAAFQAYFDYVNANGGLNGHQVKVVTADDQNLAPIGIANLKQFAEQDHALLTAWASESIPIAGAEPFLDQYQIPAIAPFPPSASLFPTPHKWTFSLNVPTAVTPVGQVAAISTIFLKGAPGKVALMRVSTPAIDDFAAAFKKAAPAKNVTVVADETFVLTASDFSAQAGAVLRAAPDAVLISGAPQTTIGTLDAIRVRNPTIPILGQLTNYQQMTDRNDPNMIWVDNNHWDYTSTSEGMKTYLAVAKVANVDAATYDNGNYKVGYLEAVAAGEALKKCGVGCTPVKVQQILEGLTIDFKGLTPNMSFSATNHIGPTVQVFWGLKDKQVIHLADIPLN